MRRGPFSPYSGPDVQTIIESAYNEKTQAEAKPGDIVVWYRVPGDLCTAHHSAILTKVNIVDGKFDVTETKFDTKNGPRDRDTNMSLNQMPASYGSNIKVYRKK